MIETLAQWWCRRFHGGIFWPVRGTYRCSVCLRTWQVPWEEPAAAPPKDAASAAWSPATPPLAQQHLAR